MANLAAKKTFQLTNGDNMRRMNLSSFGAPVDVHFERMKGGIATVHKLMKKLDELIEKRQMAETYLVSMDILSISNVVGQDAREVFEHPENEEQKQIAKDALQWVRDIAKLTEDNINSMLEHVQDNLL